MNNNIPNLIPYSSSQTVKGIAIILVLFHHLAGASREILLLHPFLAVGSLACSIFFFYSGYGLESAYHSDIMYLNDYPKKRLSKVIVPFILANLIFIVVLTFFGFVNYTIKDIFLNIIGIQLVDPNKWYVIATIFLYIGFYFAHFKSNNKVLSVIIVLVSIVLYGLTYKSIGGFFSMVCFPLGMIFFHYENLIKRFIDSNRRILLVVNLLLFLSLFIIVFAMNNIFNTPIKAMTVTLFDITFVTLMILIINTNNYSNKILNHFGDLSMDLYFMHGLVIVFYSKYFGGTFFGIFTYFAISYLVSLAFRKMRMYKIK